MYSISSRKKVPRGKMRLSCGINGHFARKCARTRCYDCGKEGHIVGNYT